MGTAEDEFGAPPGDGLAVFGTSALGRDLDRVDWSATPLGPVTAWPQSLTSTVRTVLGSRFSMWMAWGPDLTFFCNDAYRRDTLAAKYPWALGQPARAVWAEIWPDIGPRIRSVMATGEATWDEALMLFVERSGYTEESYHTFSYSPLTDESGVVAGMLCVVSEETERVIAQRQMATAVALAGELADAATEPEVCAAAQRRLAFDSRSLPFALCYLFSPDASIAESVFGVGIDGTHPAAPPVILVDDPDAVWPAAALARGETVTVDLDPDADLPTGAWELPPRQAIAVPLVQLGQRRPYGFLVVGLNRYRPLDAGYHGYLGLVAGQIAAALNRARAYEAERSQVERLAELDRAKTAFFTNVSHELRTPLTLLLGPAEDALSDPDAPLPTSQHERLTLIQRNAERLLKLVNTLLDFSRLEAGQVTPAFEPVALGPYTAELASMFESEIQRAGLTLVVDTGSVLGEVYVDREMWAKIVMNLLSNALKATFTGTITVAVHDEGDGVVLAVTDTGVGIAPSEQGRLFERFHRVAGAQLRSHEGSGIGLALVAELAAGHGGTVAVSSALGRGSTFTVRVPFGSDHLPADQVHPGGIGPGPDLGRLGAGYLAEASRWRQPDRSEPITPDDDGRKRVLVVDDNADMRGYVATLLAPDYTVVTAVDGVAALVQVHDHPPDLVLTDVMMPRLDGFGLLHALRADPDTMHIPVVMLSARSGGEATIEGLEAGADDYLVKPFSARELRARVRSNLELDRARRLTDELHRSQDLLNHAEALAQVGSWDLDLRNNTITGTAEYFRLLGIGRGDPSDLSGALAVVHPDDVDPIIAALTRSRETGAAFDVSARLEPPGQPERVVHAQGVVERDDDGRPTRLRGSIQDVTDQRRAERAIANAAAEREALAREHRIADELQRSLLPPRTFDPEHLEVATYYRPGVEGTQVGGDWYDVIELPERRTALVLGDVMGRGVPAAAVMGQLRATVRAYARLDLPPGDLLHLLDEAVREIGESTIVTCVYAVYDPIAATLTYANAGHLPPLLSIARQPAQRLTSGGPPLGASRRAPANAVVQLQPGAIVTFYTDGLVERRHEDIDIGIDNLAAMLAAITGPVNNVPDILVDALLPDGPEDDIAVLIARVPDGPAPVDTATLDVSAGPDAPSRARRFATRILQEWQAPALLPDTQLVVSELVTNAILHGAPPVRLVLHRADDGLLVEVRDQSSDDPEPYDAGPADDHGRGLHIVAAVARAWGTRRSPEGKVVWCRLAWPPGR